MEGTKETQGDIRDHDPSNHALTLLLEAATELDPRVRLVGPPPECSEGVAIAVDAACDFAGTVCFPVSVPDIGNVIVTFEAKEEDGEEFIRPRPIAVVDDAGMPVEGRVEAACDWLFTAWKHGQGILTRDMLRSPNT